MTLPLQREGWVVRSLADRDRLQLLGLSSLSLASLLAPMFFRSWLPVEIRTGLLGIGTVASVIATAQAYENATQERQEEYQRVHRIQKETHKNRLAHEINTHELTMEAASKTRMAQVIQRFPVPQRAALAQQYGLMQFVSFPEVPQSTEPKAELKPAIEVTVGQNVDHLIPPAEGPPTDWMNDAFWLQSKTVLGIRGSGKSILLKNEAAAFKHIAPKGILFINDPHFDADPEPEQAEEQWLRPIPVDILLRDYVRAGIAQAGLSSQLERWRQFRRIMRDRVHRGDKVGSRAKREFEQTGSTKEAVVKLIQDEFIGFLDKLSDDEAKEVVSIIEECNYEWRKFGGEITLGIHSFKTKKTGIDSSVLLAMTFVSLGNSLADPNTRWSGDINASALLADQEALSHQWPNYFNCVLREANKKPVALVMPTLRWPMLNLSPQPTPEPPSATGVEPDPWSESPSETPDKGGATERGAEKGMDAAISILKSWLETLGEPPTDPDLLKKFYEVMPEIKGRLNEAGIRFLKEKLGLL